MGKVDMDTKKWGDLKVPKSAAKGEWWPKGMARG